MSFHPNAFNTVESAPAWMTMSERVVLYALIVGLRPSRVLEIGTFRGGSTRIICAAMDDLDCGKVVCVDPVPQIAPNDHEKVAHRATMIAEHSPFALEAALLAAAGPFDFALIDGDHSYQGLVRDIEGVLTVLSPSAHLLFHDAHYYEVGEAIDSCIAAHPEELKDAGLVSVEVTPHTETVEGREISWGGLRMVLYSRQVKDSRQ